MSLRFPSATTILGTITSLLSSRLASPNSPHAVAIDRSLTEGPLSKFGACCVDAALREYVIKLARETGPSILPSLETILLRNQESRVKEREQAEKASMEHARLVAEKVAEDTATRVATRIHEMLAPSIELLTRQAAAMTDTKSEEKTPPPTKVSSAAKTPAKTSVPPDVVQPAEAKSALVEFVSQVKWLQNDKDISQRIAKVSEKVPAVTAKFKVPAGQATQMARLSLYDFIVICDNTNSMKSKTEPRKASQEATVRGLFSVLRALGSTQPFSVVPFTGATYEGLSSPAAVDGALSKMVYQRGPSALVPLQTRVLRPLEELAREKRLAPTVVVVITDGDTGDVADFRKAIGNFKTVVREHYPGPAVLFLVCRVGNDVAAAESLKALNLDPDIHDMVLYSEDSLDSKLAEMKNDVDHYTGWVVGELLKAMELQLVQHH